MVHSRQSFPPRWQARQGWESVRNDSPPPSPTHPLLRPRPWRVMNLQSPSNTHQTPDCNKLQHYRILGSVGEINYFIRYALHYLCSNTQLWKFTAFSTVLRNSHVFQNLITPSLRMTQLWYITWSFFCHHSSGDIHIPYGHIKTLVVTWSGPKYIAVFFFKLLLIFPSHIFLWYKGPTFWVFDELFTLWMISAMKRNILHLT